MTTTATTTERAVVFCARGVTKTYRMGLVEVRALAGVDLHLVESEFLVLLGPSGSGKACADRIPAGPRRLRVPVL